MLRTEHNDTLTFITQPDHGRLAGMLAAHWGNDLFTAPGHYGNPAEADRLRSEVLLGIAEHDNGWWEWESDPSITVETGHPMGLGEVLQDQQAGMDRWHLGTARLPTHPYASLLISWHAYWLYAIRVVDQPDARFTHPLFWKGAPEQLYPGALDLPKEFLSGLAVTQKRLEQTILDDECGANWLGDDVIKPNIRLLQLCDGLSLALCSKLIPATSGITNGLGSDDFSLIGVPRAGWDDLVDISVRALGNNRLVLDPYPFDVPELTVSVPAKILPAGVTSDQPIHAWWHSVPLQLITWTLVAP
jgi:hypothetical protein